MSVGYTELLNGMIANASGWAINIPENWMQGRTTYGGLSAALCLQATLNDHANLPSLRSAQINFIGPAGGDVVMSSQVLRQGKSVSFVEAVMEGEKGLATKATFCFGGERESRLNRDFTIAPDCPSISGSENFFKDGPGPVFTANFDCLLAQGDHPGSASTKHEHFMWIRFKEHVEISPVSLLAIADMPPPAVLPMFDGFAPISSMTWMVNFIQDEPTTDDGWWLMRTCAEHAKQGYSSQDMQIWNSNRELVLTGRQNVAIFY